MQKQPITQQITDRVRRIHSRIQVETKAAQDIVTVAQSVKETLALTVAVEGQVEEQYNLLLYKAQALEEGLTGYAKELGQFNRDLEETTQADTRISSELKQIIMQLGIVLANWQESTEVIEDDIRQDLAQVLTLLQNLSVFFGDPDELALLLSTIQTDVLEQALAKLDETR